MEGFVRRSAFNLVQDPYANAYERVWRDPFKLALKDRVIGRGGWVADLGVDQVQPNNLREYEKVAAATLQKQVLLQWHKTMRSRKSPRTFLQRLAHSNGN